MFSLFRYLKNKQLNRDRILALDLLRGTFLIVIITTHIAWRPSLFTFVGGEGQLLASAAEGFFAISGLLVGYLYTPKILKETKKTFKKIWKRAFLLYALTVFFTFFYTAWAVLEPHSQAYQTLYIRDAGKFIVDTLTLRYAFGWADFLNRYALFMFIAPFAVWLIAKGKAWVVALISFVIWFFWRATIQFVPFSAWQLIFMYGIILGYYLPSLEAIFKNLSKRWQKSIFAIIISISLISYLFSMFVFVIAPLILPLESPVLQFRDQLGAYFNKDYVAPARVVVGIIWFAALYMFYRVYEKQISKITRGILEVFGRQSLFVYCVHAFFIFAIDIYFKPPAPNLIVLNTIVTLFVLAAIYLLARHRSQLTAYSKKIFRNKNITTVP